MGTINLRFHLPQLLGKKNLRNIVCYTISNGYVNKPVIFILFIINIISYSNKEPCRWPLLDQERF